MSICDSKLKNDKASRILCAALEEFMAAGFKDAKIEEIAKRAGVGKGTVYQYYTSKEHLFEAMIDDGMAHYVVGLREVLSAEDSFLDNLKRLVHMHKGFIEDHQAIAQLFYSHEIQLTDQIKRTFTKHQGDVIAILGAWMMAMTLKGDIGPEVNYRLLLSTIFGTLNQYYAPHIPGDDELLSADAFAHKLYQMLMVI